MKAAGPGQINGAPVLRPPVEVTLGRDELRQLLVKVSVRSKLRPASMFVGTIPASEILSLTEIRRKVEVLAGALAEQLCERLGDSFLDPDECARSAGQAWDDLMKHRATEALPL